MPNISANGVNLYYEIRGDDAGVPVMLIHGLATPMNAWPEAMISELVQRGFRIIQFDNRDAGRSEKMSAFGKANIALMMLGQRFGFEPKSAYTIEDMSNDALALLDALGIRQAAIVGASMGAMIAQRMAASAPDRVASLCSVMSSSGAPGLPKARKAVLDLLYTAPPPRNRRKSLEHSYRFWRAIGSRTCPDKEADLRQFLADLADWAPADGDAGGRHFAAIYADRDRYKVLPSIRAPTLVIHGLEDTLVPPACGQDTASRIRGARFLAVPGMGHDFPAALIPSITQAIAGHLQDNPISEFSLELA